MNSDERKRYATHAAHLAWTLTPDLKEMDMRETAKDVRLAATMISELMGKVDALTHRMKLDSHNYQAKIRNLELELAEAHLHELGLMGD